MPSTNEGKNTKKLISIKHIIMMGDSLSDRGTSNKSTVLGCIPMSSLNGLKGKSPDGRFTNGLVWSDHVSAKIASDFTIKRLQKKWHLDDTDVSDAIICHDRRIVSAIRDNYSLDDDYFINYLGKVWVRSYCVGGLMAHDYSWMASSSLIRFFTRLIVASLDDLRKKVLKYDKKNHISYEQKAETLIIEWSGANDLVTVNAKPSIEEVDKAITARMDNIKKMIAAGYRNFIVMNLPNLSLTPRYQAKSVEDQYLAKTCSDYFNTKLQEACEQLSDSYPHCEVNAFDVNFLFEMIYHNPEQYLLDKDKLKIPYNTSVDFDDPKDGTSHATGYMFYDDLHPSADLHALLAAYFYDQLPLKYELLEPNQVKCNKKEPLPEEVLLRCFRSHYAAQKTHDNRFVGHTKSTLDYKNANLEVILKHALNEEGKRTMAVLNKLGWVDKHGELILKEPALIKALDKVYPTDFKESSAHLSLNRTQSATW